MLDRPSTFIRVVQLVKLIEDVNYMLHISNINKYVFQCNDL